MHVRWRVAGGDRYCLFGELKCMRCVFPVERGGRTQQFSPDRDSAIWLPQAFFRHSLPLLGQIVADIR